MADEHHAKDHPLIVSAQIPEAKWPDQPLVVPPPEAEVRRNIKKDRINLGLAVIALIFTGILPLLVRYHEEKATER
jgi:hypothetical protein